MTAPLLETRGLHGGYAGSPVLFDIDLQVGAAEIVGLIGRNGMGKTTLVRSIMGLTPAFSGAIRVDGRSTIGLPAHRVARLGLALVPEGRQVFANLSVEEHLGAFQRAAADGQSRWNAVGCLAILSSDLYVNHDTPHLLNFQVSFARKCLSISECIPATSQSSTGSTVTQRRRIDVYVRGVSFFTPLRPCSAPRTSSTSALRRARSSMRSHDRPAAVRLNASGSSTLVHDTSSQCRCPSSSKNVTRSSPQCRVRVTSTKRLPRHGWNG
jgi:energy-coupling factor transporter ATP-binding protein EcfA2